MQLAVEVRRAVECGAGVYGVLAAAGRDAAHDGVRVGFEFVAVRAELVAADAPREVCARALAHVNSDRVETAQTASDSSEPSANRRAE